MKVKILKTMQGSPDGVSVETYHEGKTCEIPKALAQVFLDEGWAEPVKKKEKKIDPPAGGGEKNNGGASENKNQGGAGENKGQDGAASGAVTTTTPGQGKNKTGKNKP